MEGITAIHELSLFPEHLGAFAPRSIVLLEQVFTKSPSKSRHYGLDVTGVDPLHEFLTGRTIAPQAYFTAAG